MGIFSADLTTFFTECKIVDACQYHAYTTRYDGLALGHWVDLVAHSPAPSVTYTGTGTDTIAAGSAVTNLPAAGVLCDAETFNCWGWKL